MRANLRYLLSAALLLVVLGYVSADRRVANSIIAVDCYIYDSAQELVEDSDLVVTGYSIASVNHVTTTPEGYTNQSYTLTDFQISTVLKASAPDAKEIGTGETIAVIEPTYLYERGILPGAIRFSVDGYQQMKPGVEYILCLQVIPDQRRFKISGIVQGKHGRGQSDDDFKEQPPERSAKLDRLREEIESLFDLR